MRRKFARERKQELGAARRNQVAFPYLFIKKHAVPFSGPRALLVSMGQCAVDASTQRTQTDSFRRS